MIDQHSHGDQKPLDPQLIHAYIPTTQTNLTSHAFPKEHFTQLSSILGNQSKETIRITIKYTTSTALNFNLFPICFNPAHSHQSQIQEQKKKKVEAENGRLRQQNSPFNRPRRTRHALQQRAGDKALQRGHRLRIRHHRRRR